MSNRHTPPWRDRIQRAAATPVAQVPFRESTGLWRTMMSKLESEDQERRFHKRLPASWRTEVEGLPVPIWLKGVLLWLLNVPRWIYFLTFGSLFLVTSLGIIITAVSVCQLPVEAGPHSDPGRGVRPRPVTSTPRTAACSPTSTAHQPPVDPTLDQMSTPLKQAVLAAEDGNFYKHKALDFGALIRAAFKDIFAGHWVEGGSTITQQYVKLNYLGQQRTFNR